MYVCIYMYRYSKAGERPYSIVDKKGSHKVYGLKPQTVEVSISCSTIKAL